jgi:hypothetical protein
MMWAVKGEHDSGIVDGEHAIRHPDKETVLDHAGYGLDTHGEGRGFGNRSSGAV